MPVRGVGGVPCHACARRGQARKKRLLLYGRSRSRCYEPLGHSRSLVPDAREGLPARRQAQWHEVAFYSSYLGSIQIMMFVDQQRAAIKAAHHASFDITRMDDVS